MSTWTPEHKQTTIFYSSKGTSKSALVDEGLSKFILHLWSENFDTVYSCQGDGSTSVNRYIMFLNIEQAEIFQEQYGGFLDSLGYIGGRACVRRFKIPEKFKIKKAKEYSNSNSERGQR